MRATVARSARGWASVGRSISSAAGSAYARRSVPPPPLDRVRSRAQELGRKSSLFLTCSAGLEATLEREIAELSLDYDLQATAFRKGVHVVLPDVRPGEWTRGAVPPSLRRAIADLNLRSRVATRVLAPLRKPFAAASPRLLYERVRDVDWAPFFDRGDGFRTLRVQAAAYNNAEFDNDMYAAQVVKDAIVDQLRERTGSRPDVDREAPEVQLDLFLDGETAVLSLDTSGEPLFKRGYRAQRGEAPLQESLAAGLLLLAHYRGAEEALCDPMCGSGTLLVEAAMLATGTPPGALRPRWAFEALPGFTPADLQRARADAAARSKPGALGGGRARLMGADASPAMVAAAEANLRAAGFGAQLDSGAVRLEVAEVAAYAPEPPPDVVVTNPPYGLRMAAGRGAAAGPAGYGRGLETRRGAAGAAGLPLLYKQLGDFLKQRTSRGGGSRGYVFVGELECSKLVGLRTRRRHELSQGGLEARLLEYELYAGSRRPGPRAAPDDPPDAAGA